MDTTEQISDAANNPLSSQTKDISPSIKKDNMFKAHEALSPEFGKLSKNKFSSGLNIVRKFSDEPDNKFGSETPVRFGQSLNDNSP